MDIVEFLEARIAEEESEILHAKPDDSEYATSLANQMRAECAQKRAILAGWKRAAAAEGISSPAEAQGPLARARLSMLAILAAGYRAHPEYPSD